MSTSIFHRNTRKSILQLLVVWDYTIVEKNNGKASCRQSVGAIWLDCIYTSSSINSARVKTKTRLERQLPPSSAQLHQSTGVDALPLTAAVLLTREC